MKKQYKIKYLGRGRTIDIVEARYPKEAIQKIIKPIYFVAEEIKTAKIIRGEHGGSVKRREKRTRR